MAGRTKLYQRAGSPLIHGHSRYERPGWIDWAIAYALCLVVLYAMHTVATLTDSSRTSFASLSAVLTWLVAPGRGLIAAAVGAALGVWPARSFGSRGAWLAGAVLGTLFSVTAMYL